jgi:uncharacterized protein YhaN
MTLDEQLALSLKYAGVLEGAHGRLLDTFAQLKGQHEESVKLVEYLNGRVAVLESEEDDFVERVEGLLKANESLRIERNDLRDELRDLKAEFREATNDRSHER